MKRFLGLFVCLLFAFCVNAQVVQPPISTIPIGPPPVAPAYLQVQMWGSGAVNDGTTPLIPGMFYRFNIQQDAMTTVYVTWVNQFGQVQSQAVNVTLSPGCTTLVQVYYGNIGAWKYRPPRMWPD